MSQSRKVTKEDYFETAYIHAREFTAQALRGLEKLNGVKLDSMGKSVIFGVILQACVFEGLITLRKLNEVAFDVSELLSASHEDLEKWVMANKLGEINDRP